VLLIIAIAAIIALFIKSNQLEKERKNNKVITSLNQRLTELNNKKSKLIGTASHDLSTPLASIEMWHQLLKGSKADWNDEQVKSHEMIQEALQYGHRLLARMVELESLIPEKISIERFDFGTLAEALVENKKNLPIPVLKWHADISKPAFLSADKLLIKKMCEAILSGIIENSKIESEIFVRLYEEDRETVLQVKHEALDPFKDKLSLLYSDYKQISANKNKIPSLSKLTIAQRIVEEMNGSITFRNAGGQVFITVRFPNQSIQE